jgi:hypothetical protein
VCPAGAIGMASGAVAARLFPVANRAVRIVRTGAEADQVGHVERGVHPDPVQLHQVRFELAQLARRGESSTDLEPRGSPGRRAPCQEAVEGGLHEIGRFQ